MKITNAKNLLGLIAVVTGVWMPVLINAQSNENIVVKVDQPIAPIQPTMWGIFFEDINLGADGGIYAELVKNRSFEFASPLMGWARQGKNFREGDLLILNRQEANAANPRYIRVNSHSTTKGEQGMTNEGFRGMGIKKGVGYDFSIMYRQQNPGVKLNIELADTTGKILG
ncbi:MAG TPA: alpha-L-arabinofuranosidase, partial [Segetibacter sp.]